MKLNEIAIEYHDTLNPKLWDKNQQLKLEVKKTLVKIAKKFIEFLNIDESFIQDAIITGSNCNYNWTDKSDLDLHLIVNYENFQSSCQIVDIDDFFRDKKSLWNDQHDITIYDIPLELYVQNIEQESPVNSGTYSFAKNEWLQQPTKIDSKNLDDKLIDLKYTNIKEIIDDLINNKVDDAEAIEKIKDKIYDMRKTGLKKNGEFSPETLAFKKLRTAGYLEKLQKYLANLKDKNLSLS